MIRRLFVLVVICVMACNLPAARDKKVRVTRRARAAKAKSAPKPAAKVKDVKVSVGTCESLRMAVEDLIKTFGSQYPDGKKYLGRLGVLQGRMQKGIESAALQEEFLTLQRRALTANPLLDFGRVLLVKRELGNKARSAAGGALGLPTLNARTNDTIRNPGTGWNDSVVEMSDLDGDCVLRTVYKGVHGQIVCDMDLHFDGRRIRASHILLRPEQIDSPRQVVQAIRRARQLRQQIEAGQIRFAEAAKKYSTEFAVQRYIESIIGNRAFGSRQWCSSGCSKSQLKSV